MLNLLFFIIITPVISLTLTKIMFMCENGMIVADALERIDSVLSYSKYSNNLYKYMQVVIPYIF